MSEGDGTVTVTVEIKQGTVGDGQTFSLEFTTRDNKALSKCCKATNKYKLQLNFLQCCGKVIISPFIWNLMCTYIFCMAIHFKAI